jgi:alpha-N-acetylglucosamine transferase
LPIEMVGVEQYDVFRDYILFRKMYVFKLLQYDRVLLLDIDGVVTGEAARLFQRSGGREYAQRVPLAAPWRKMVLTLRINLESVEK